MANRVKKSEFSWEQIEGAVGHIQPVIIDGTWYVWDISAMEYVSTGVIAESATYAERAETAADNAEANAETASNAAATATGAASAATNASEAAGNAAAAAAAWSSNPPYIGNNGNWWVYDSESKAFVDSGIDASITVQIADITEIAATEAPYITNTGTNTDPVFHLFLPAANGITSITKSGTSGLVDTYTITYANGNTSTFSVTNGADGQGNVSSVNNVKPIGGNVTLTAADVGARPNTWTPTAEDIGAESTENRVTGIDASSTDDTYPTAKAVYALFNSIVNGNNIQY